ncbi:pyrroloquinoline quinone-dependent dehydrogenase [Rhizorhabdus wittichii]|uniref:Pyrroloquinoline quinone-dependent dehydrogenase n=1 Tax=Rhizorhabdus wittichii TaxID=160791 RepID=A0A975HFI1_9SPHN|nr:pyrroloquinoline quinone-dependent dehydrogenase [Rhizorhabdus wittichii]QTH23415.1 pyrroloquinoline quinone-dependent dehydrogenase [Rhizorhabdus wittichii]
MARGRRLGRAALAVVALLLLAYAVAWGIRLLPPLGPLRIATHSPAETPWDQWGATAGGTRFTPAAQITPGNVAHLRVAWRYSTGELARRPEGMQVNSTNETTPILAAGSLVTCTPFGRVIALDPATGREKWTYDAKVDPSFKLPDQYICRGVSQWRDARAADPAGMCATRIILATVDMRVIALDARTGRPCAGFGEGGTVRVDPGKLHHVGEVKLAAPAAIVRDSIVIGTSVLDNVRANAPRGIIRAFDARSGREIWTFDPIPQQGGPDRDWMGDSRRTTGAANVWSVISGDPELDMVYLPTSSASPDYYGGLRPGDNRHANSVVALDATTGRLVWARQLIHHDIWDYDTPAQPTLVDIDRGGRRIPALVQPTKQGYVFVFDRRTGAPLFPIDEVAVPQGGVPGEWLSPTQPRPRLPRPIVPQKITPDQAWGFTPWDKAKCRDLIVRYRSEGLFTPITERGTITYPAASGGANWGAGAIDPARQVFFINSSRVASVIKLRKRKPGGSGTVQLSATEDVSPMAGTPYEVKREWLLSPFGAPCTPPPWGGLTAIDLKTGATLWDVPLGTINDRLPIPLPFDVALGTPNIGGPVATAGGVLFIAATMDRHLRAIDMRTGKELWRDRLPGGSQTTPMSYMAGGRQYVVVASGQHMWFQTPRSDEIVAYALPMK